MKRMGKTNNRGMGTVEIILIIVDIRGKPKLCKYCLMQMAFR